MALQLPSVCLHIFLKNLNTHFLISTFEERLENLNLSLSEKTEYLLPTIVGELLEGGVADVTVLKSEDEWFGVTYKEDKEYVIESIKKLITNGVYPNKLF